MECDLFVWVERRVLLLLSIVHCIRSELAVVSYQRLLSFCILRAFVSLFRYACSSLTLCHSPMRRCFMCTRARVYVCSCGWVANPFAMAYLCIWWRKEETWAIIMIFFGPESNSFRSGSLCEWSSVGTRMQFGFSDWRLPLWYTQSQLGIFLFMIMCFHWLYDSKHHITVDI